MGHVLTFMMFKSARAMSKLSLAVYSLKNCSDAVIVFNLLSSLVFSYLTYTPVFKCIPIYTHV